MKYYKRYFNFLSSWGLIYNLCDLKMAIWGKPHRPHPQHDYTQNLLHQHSFNSGFPDFKLRPHSQVV
jgi:hypothetical protein